MDNGQAAEGLVERARRGDQEAWAALYTSVYARLVSFAHRRLGNADLARDAVSETMARAVTRLDTYVGTDEGFAPWLFGICRHVVVDLQRQTYRPLPPGLLRADVDGPGPADVVIDAEEQALVRAAFARLDPDERELLELRVVGGLSSA
ncbi:MAG TPA: sigma-70 family RNA polymerase sigma factor, partial [Acidimicrobiia bacterium]|nr:sigma-70 family RNA polymerase sigma factor [Acidimicrobiia bacterium]